MKEYSKKNNAEFSYSKRWKRYWRPSRKSILWILFCINSCMYNMDHIHTTTLPLFLPDKNMWWFFNNIHQKSGYILHSNNGSPGVKENYKISSLRTHFVTTVIHLDYSFTTCELWQPFPACVWTVMMGLNNNEKRIRCIVFIVRV